MPDGRRRFSLETQARLANDESLIVDTPRPALESQ